MSDTKKPDWDGWKREFYPTDVTTPRTQISATRHSIQKWKGATPENLKKYGLSSPPIAFDSRACALCELYQGPDEGDDCTHCPLFIARSGVRCDEKMPGEERSPYSEYCDKRNIEPMRKWLDEALLVVTE